MGEGTENKVVPLSRGGKGMGVSSEHQLRQRDAAVIERTKHLIRQNSEIREAVTGALNKTGQTVLVVPDGEGSVDDVLVMSEIPKLARYILLASEKEQPAIMTGIQIWLQEDFSAVGDRRPQLEIFGRRISVRWSPALT